MSAPNGAPVKGDNGTVLERPLIIQAGATRVSFPIPTTGDVWIAAEILREEFKHEYTPRDAPQPGPSEEETSAKPAATREAQVELATAFLGFVASKIRKSDETQSELEKQLESEEQSKSKGQPKSVEQSKLENQLESERESNKARTRVLQETTTHFTSKFLTNGDIHSMAATFDTDVRKSVLTSYFLAISTLGRVPPQPGSALLNAAALGKAEIYALFGGQGTNEVYFEELKSLYEIYKPYVSEYIKEMQNTLVGLADEASKKNLTFFTHGLAVLGWLDGSVPVPPLEYLASVPVSFPVIGLTQLVQYLVVASVTGSTPGELRSRIKGATGHSQGILSAVVAATSTDLDSFIRNSIKALRWWVWAGARGQEAFPVLAVEPNIVKDAVDGGEGVPSPMLSVTGLPLAALEKHIAGVNKHLPANSQLSVALHNGSRAFVVVGPPRALYGLVTALRKVRAPSGLDQSKVPFSQRKAVFNVRFLVVGVPYHSHYLDGTTEKVLADLGEELWDAKELGIAVYHTETGADLRELSTSVTRSLCEQVLSLPIQWTKATAFPDSATHAIDFGPGGLSGIGPLTARGLEGRGVRVVIVGEKGKNGAEIYDSTKPEPRGEISWSEKWTPRLVRNSDGKIQLDTPFSRLLGKPPIMVAGMTPTTVKAGFVSAVLSAGYHVELAGGGHYNATALREKVAEIQTLIPPGVGLTLNALYINQRQFGFQFPLWQEMRREGLPIEGFCVAAGIPSTEKAKEIIDGLRAAGIRHVSFKPGSVDGIRQVVNIASQHPGFPIILQWTGGRAGGHHSCEDFHQPILQTYAAIRQQDNISLVAGSGFGGSEDVWPYMSGEWSAQFGAQPMPFDGVLFASRVMVAKEAHTSKSVKDLIVAAPGVDDAKWEGTYAKETGGILTVKSELGEPIHKVATRGVKLWKEFDDTVFKLPKEKRAAWLAQNKDMVIEKLNKDFAKPWFAQKGDGRVVGDIGDMTYEEVVRRMVRLMYVEHQTRWIDRSLRNLVGDWLRRVEERFAGGDVRRSESVLQSYDQLDVPQKLLYEFFNTYPLASEQLLAAEDKAYFLAIAQRPGQKPVPFIPVLDTSFEVWFKKDSLWAAEDIEAVFDQDPQRVCILQGPVAVKHTKVADEPIKDILDNVESGLVSKFLEKYYDGDESKVGYIGAQPTSEDATPPVSVGELPSLRDPWLRAALTSINVVQGGSYIDNPLKRIFAPRRGQNASVRRENGQIYQVAVTGAARSHGANDSSFKAIELTFDPSSSRISLTIFEERNGSKIPLQLAFDYKPSMGYAPIHEVTEGRNWRIKEFYWKLWFGDNETLPEIDIRDTFVGPEVTITAEAVERFCAVVGNQGEQFKSARYERVQAPMDFAIVTGWQAIMKSIFPKAVDGDLLKLVHLSNGFKMVEGATPLLVGDVCKAEARIASVTNSDSGKTVKVTGFVLRDGKPVIEVTSSFLYRGAFTDYQNTFEIVEEPEYVVKIGSAVDVGVLNSKEWFEWDNDSQPLEPGTTLIFKVKSEYKYKAKATYSSVAVEGNAYIRNQLKELVKVATVSYSIDHAHGNPVLSYLSRHGEVQGDVKKFDGNGYTLTSSAVSSSFIAPATNEPYSKISGDFNPIHINPYFSDYAALPGTITHGMWSSAATRKYVENVVAQGRPERVLQYDVSFVGMVLPGDELTVKLTHYGMRDGNLAIKVETSNQRGERVLSGTAEVAQAPTAYVFTGQGSQEPGMGMELYNSSPAARAVWEAADAHLLAVYGISIVDIVKNNPKEKTIHFGGIKGQDIRKRYMAMSYDTTDKDGNIKTLPLFADIHVRTPQYTFRHPSGLLFATQFAQIALVVTEKAAFEDMKSKGLVQKDCAFAGHSLGEYSALASIADVLAISALVDVVFYRGITMQRAVERDEHNRSNYAMCAVNPSRISKSFNDAALREVVDTVSHETNLLLEIVNYNVEGQQYVCAGELLALETLTNVLNYLKVKKIDIQQLTEQFTIEQVKEMLKEIITSCLDKAKEKQKAEGYIKLERGFATIPLPGIDVPFHSRYLWAGVMPFRTYLSKKINPLHLNPDLLVGKYIPNLIAKPFEVTKEYAQIIYDQTSSPRLEKVLTNWDRDDWGSAEQRQKLAYTILVELLAYQFASPVRWIQTQDLLFSHYNFERLVELGPGPTLTGMATRTLKAKYEAGDGAVSRVRQILCHAKNSKEIYYQFEDETVDTPTQTIVTTPAPVATRPPVAAPVAAPPAPPAGAAAASIPDEPLKAVDTLRVIIAQKLKKKVDEIPISKAIKDLVGGKSTLQNEILGDLQLEFSSAPEKGEELPLDELGAALSVGYTGALGKHTNGLVSRMIGGKMPGGFNATTAKAHLNKTWGLGPARSDAALLLGVTMEPAKRLGSEAEAKSWLDSVAAEYAKQAGIRLSSGGGSGGAAASGGAVMNSEEFLKFQAEQQLFAAQHVELYMRYLKRDSRAGARAYDEEKDNAAALQAKLDDIAKEHGDAYIQGIQPIFEPLKARHFNSSWNWVRQDALLMWYDIIFGRLTAVDREITSRCIAIMNRADPTLLRYMQYYIDNCHPEKGETYALAKQFGQQLIDNCREVIGQPPIYRDVTFPTAPKTEVNEKGDIIYSEVVREGVRKLEAYVEEMASGDNIPGNVNIQKVHDDVVKLWNAVKSQPEISQDQKSRIKALYDSVVRSLRKGSEFSLKPTRPVARTRRASSQFLRPQVSQVTSLSADKIPLLHLKRKVGGNWEYSSNLTGVYLDVLHEIATSGTSFKDKNALLTGVGKGSIGVEILKGLLQGGARVVITTSRYSRASVEYYQGIYHQCGSRDSSLTVVPFNQGSKQDVEALVDYVYSNLGLDLDYILPFAAIPENGREIDGIDDRSELAHRVMLVNLLRLLGAVKNKKASRHIVTRPTQVILPLSPNHGLFGNDGLYSESKISLETLFQRWNSESWGEYLCLAGAVIGWTRGTGLMGATNMVAQQVESYGVRTFSANEMAFNILGLMHPLLFSITQVEPIWADLNGGMDRLADLAEITTRIRLEINHQSDLRRAIARDNAADFKVVNGNKAESALQTVTVTPRANHRYNFPKLEAPEALEELSKLQGLVDLEKVIVVAGFAEVGPWGSSRTRWEMEARGQFTIEGCIEMAWMMGYIKHFDGRLKNGNLYVGWVDSKTADPVDDKDVRGKYEKEILEHSGIRLIEPELFKGYDPKKKVFHQEIELNHDLEPLEVSEAEARKFKLEHGDKVDIWAQESGEYLVKLKKGARVLVPKAFRFDRLVAGQIPTGWDAGRYGIPQDIVTQTDRTALWALVCTAEALIMSGITDPYELYKHVHPSEVGSSLGSGMGGMQSLAAMFKDRREEKDVQKDILQETFINTVAGWVNLLLLSSSGPIKIPVGACATALQSLEIACDTILSGKAKVMIAGGFDDFSEEGSFEFANMKATSNTETEFAMGREPNEFSRPTTSTRAGFMESQGTGVQVLMNAKTALEMGCAIQSIVAFTSTSTDKAGRSIPAPGRGVLSVAREITPKQSLRILDVDYRLRQLAFRRKQISEWMENELETLKDDPDAAELAAEVEKEAARQEKDALATYGMLEGSDPRIAPLRRALAVWGLTADDIGVISIHGTSTKANDLNEPHVYNDIFTAIQRTPGNAVPVIAQKNLTGHPKGAAAAWMLLGLCQCINSGVIPGNRNADNIDPALRDFEYLVFPSRSIHTDGIKAGLMTSFGFGQVGGSALILHPRYLFASIGASEYKAYTERNRIRAMSSYKAMSEMMTTNSLVKIKEHPPFAPEIEGDVLLNPLARTKLDNAGEFSFPKELDRSPKVAKENQDVLANALKGVQGDLKGVGVDQELISAVPSHNPTFVKRNFTDSEITYCRGQPHPEASFAARWAGKEAVFKALGVKSKGASAAMSDIEILPDESGVPVVSLHGDAKKAADEKGIAKVLVSLSHSENVAIAFAQAS
ncbi:fatty acid synthase subunit beta, fungi type [Rhizoctonia solani]|uniref:Fatty acid synthase subunit beta, fungi type n=1 Tax=Rhizoctonia solani TaxID=456999 RepID=A0A0K6FQZ3_9AGAM|nr:fatty acid synthase subunit beta, fungi type [Rhizoctonia solani]